MKLLDIIVTNAIEPNLEATSRDEAISVLVDRLIEAKAVSADHRDEFIKAIIKREKRGSTGFGHGVAVPHVKHGDIDKLVAAIGVSKDGIDFNALDGNPVHSIFLIISPEAKPEEHLEAMEAVFSNLSQDTFRRFLLQADTVEAVTTLLEEADSSKLDNA
ncbi:MAG: PTS fructose transporter subunit IIA [Phycisphaerae bacterium]|nr:PTS fructose transporter subunit IIA [Phycisphaerae bacterium]|tara:strand:+ start:556 stop:1035 length:480 start_codon:yes stop_codon:yes gene_type:complete